VIEIYIDKDACVGCTLCVNECPTDVFEFDETEGLPVVKKEIECLGCLSCFEICPAEAITYEGVEYSRNFYHDNYALGMAARLTSGIAQTVDETDLTEERKALNDLGIRLLSLAAVFRHTMSGSLPAVGTMAGRTLANQLPRYRVPESVEEVYEIAADQFSPSWSLKFDIEDDQLTVTTTDCFIRELCGTEGIELGGDLCVLFYNSLAGYLGKTSGIRFKLESMEPGEHKCVYRIRTYQREKS
jgi:NAD-dependent dihydropyrimidine dehydrogenase PreA subunit